MKKWLLLSTLLISFVGCTFAQWASGGTQVSFSADNHHRPFVSAFPGGGYYATWLSTDTSQAQKNSIRLNAFSANGSLLSGWTNGGNIISPAGDFYAPQLITSEDSSVIVAWYGYPDTASHTEVYVQKYSIGGVALWNGGAPVQVTQDTNRIYEYPFIVSDKNKGVFIVYERFDSVIDPSSTDIFLQHIDSTGNVAAGWNPASTGVAVTPNVREYYPQLALTPDQSSVYVTYGEGLIGSTSLMLNKFNVSNGALSSGWPSGGLTISSGPDVYPDINHDLKLYTDNANNAVVFWIEARLTGNGEIYMQQVDPSGNSLLTAGGIFVAGDVASTNGVDYLQVTQDADKNFLVTFNNLVNFNDVSAMRIKPNGTVLFNDTLVTTGGYSAYPQSVSDGKRGMYVFYENTNTPQKLYAIGLDSLGRRYANWALPGSSFGRISTYDPFEPNYDFSAASTDSSKAVIAWTRLLPSGLYGLFTCNLLHDGSVCTEQPLAPNTASNQSVCYGTRDTLNATASGGNAPYQYTWRAVGDTLSCTNCQSPSFVATQNSTFIVTITDADLYSESDTIRYTVTGGNNVTINSSGPDTFCQPHTVTLSTSFSATAYQWTLNGNNITGATSNSYTVSDSSGNYQLAVTETGGCPGISNIVGVSVSAGVASILTPSGPINLCAGNSTFINANVGPNFIYEWVLDGRTIATPGGNGYISASLAGTYYVIITSQGGCSDTSNTVVVNILPLPIVFFPTGAGETLCSNASAITLTGGSPAGGIYSGNGVTSDSIFNPANAQSGVNEITYTYLGPNNCSNYATEPIVVESCNGINSVSLENAIALYPNPTTGSVTLESDLFEDTKIYPVVYNIDGKVIELINESDGNTVKINTSNLAAGIYLVRLDINGNSISKRFIKAE